MRKQWCSLGWNKKGKGSFFIDFPRSHQLKAAKVMLSIFFPLSRKSTLTILSLSYFDGRWKIEGAIRTQFPPELMCSLYPLSISRHSISHNLKAMMPYHFKWKLEFLCSKFYLGRSKLQVYGTKYVYLHSHCDGVTFIWRDILHSETCLGITFIT